MQNNGKKRILNTFKLFIASISVTSLIGLWNLFSRDDQSGQADLEMDPPDPQEENIFGVPLPTLVPSVLESDSATTASQPISEVAPPLAQPTQEPVIERVVIGSSGGSGGGSASSRTSSSR